jgi:hypothetical protein
MQTEQRFVEDSARSWYFDENIGLSYRYIDNPSLKNLLIYN